MAQNNKRATNNKLVIAELEETIASKNEQIAKLNAEIKNLKEEADKTYRTNIDNYEELKDGFVTAMKVEVGKAAYWKKEFIAAKTAYINMCAMSDEGVGDIKSN